LAARPISGPLVAMPSPTSIQIQLLNFGRLLWINSQGLPSERDDSEITKAEEELIAALHAESPTALRSILNFNDNGQNIDPITLRVVCMVSYTALCTTRLGTTISEVACGIAGDDAARVLEARATISRLLIRRQLELRDEHGDCIVPARRILDFFAGGAQEPPLSPTEADLRRAWYRSEQAASRRKAKEEVPLMAKALVQRISERVVGLEREIRMLSCRMAIHLRRASLIRNDKDPGIGNECLLFVGASGAGKTFLAENAGRVSGIPFASISSGDLTATGYVGLDVSDCLQPLITASKGDPERARFGTLFLDEWDKKAIRETNWRDIGCRSVQEEMLRLMEGTMVQIGGRRSAFEHHVVHFNTYGTMFVFGGAFVGLDKMISKGAVHGIGFHDLQAGSSRASALYEGLEQFGMLPEWINRLTGIIVFPTPTLEQLVQIAERSVIPATNRLLAAFGAGIEVSPDGIRLMAEAALESKTLARGLKSLITTMTEDIVFTERQGTIHLDVAEVRRAIEAAGLGAVTSAC
jgi:ATP-dependent Clp protease ATP-binding subunit ClpX